MCNFRRWLWSRSFKVDKEPSGGKNVPRTAETRDISLISRNSEEAECG